MHALIPTTPEALPAALADTAEAATALLKARHSDTTRRVYAADALRFRDWCAASGLCPLPAEPQAVALFVAAEIGRGLNPRTVGRRLAAIRHLHREAGLLDPTAAEVVRAVLAGARRTAGGPPRQAAPATASALERMLKTCDNSLIGRRDRLLLALGFGGAFRRSELVALDVADIEVVDDGLRVFVRRSKTDQESQGQHVPVADGPRTRVKAALAAWLAVSGITEGPLFRSARKGGRSPISAWLTARWPRSSSVVPSWPGSIRLGSRVTRCAADGSPARPRLVPMCSGSWMFLATAGSRRCGSTSSA